MSITDQFIEAEVNRQLLEQGAFSPIEMLINSGYLQHDDYARWRGGELASLDQALRADRAQAWHHLEQAISYAEQIGLQRDASDRIQPEPDVFDRHRLSDDSRLAELLGRRYAPQHHNQKDLFYDSPAAALANGIAAALSQGDAAEVRRSLDLLRQVAPGHAELPDYERLAEALSYLTGDAGPTLDFMLGIEKPANRLLGAGARHLLVPLWRRVARDLACDSYHPAVPEQHSSFAFMQAESWQDVIDAVQAVSAWWRHAPLCYRLAVAAHRQGERILSLTAWCCLCWCSPATAMTHLDDSLQPDWDIRRFWLQFLDIDAEGPDLLQPQDFPAWMLLVEPGLSHGLPADLPPGQSAGEAHYRLTHALVSARRQGQTAQEMIARERLQAASPVLFRCFRERLALD